MSQAYQKTLEEWVKKWKEENLTIGIRKLINQANFDLYFGPVNDGAIGDPASSYPGFSKACDAITAALRDLPSDLYLDLDSGESSEKEPEGERCESCKGEGHYYQGDERFNCDACNGRGGFDATGDWWHVDRKDIRIAIVGKELSEYVR